MFTAKYINLYIYIYILDIIRVGKLEQPNPEPALGQKSIDPCTSQI